MLVQGIAREFDGAVELVSENFGESELAERFGVKRYPAVFVDDVLVAKPKDFGFFGTSGSQGEGRYTPWLTQANQDLFREDMRRLIAKAVEGKLASTDGVAADAAGVDGELAELPDFSLEDLGGVAISTEALRETVTIVDFWATWCPPCIAALPSLRELQLRHAEDLQIVGVVVESRKEDVERIAAEHELPFPVALGTPELAVQFGDLVAVPTAFVFDRGGKLVKTFYGSPPSLKEELEELVQELTAAR